MRKKVDRALFARNFIAGRIALFRKDTGLCLARNARRRHAYMPAFFLCMAFLEFLSGLRDGQISNVSLKAIRSFRRAHLRHKCYASPVLEILHLGFRHKLAHTGAPYPVFDTFSDPRQRLHPFGRKLVCWTIYAGGSRQHAALELECHPMRQMRRTPTPWAVHYDHRMHVRLSSFRRDLIEAARRYRDTVGKPRSRANFFRAIRKLYPRK